jgi:hypothetical protein
VSLGCLDRVFKYALLVGRTPSVALLERSLQVLLHGLLEDCWFLKSEWGVINTRNTFGGAQMMQIFCEGLKFSSS